MINVLGFFLQTLSVSAVALVLLIIKRLFQDKISPNVQYALWLVLALRIVLPVGAGVLVGIIYLEGSLRECAQQSSLP